MATIRIRRIRRIRRIAPILPIILAGNADFITEVGIFHRMHQ
jgi:hypothetical protein